MNTSDLNDNVGRFLEAPTALDFDGLTDSIFLSFKLIEPWCNVGKQGSKHPLIAAMVQRIVLQANEYSASVIQSLDTVNDGWTFASDVIALTDYMSIGQSSVEDLKSFLVSMVEFSSTAHQRALAANERFRRIRRELFQISKDIPSVLSKIETQKKRERDPSNVSDTILLPAPISPGMFVQINNGNPRISKNNKRIMEKHSLSDIMAHLERTHLDLQQLIEHVGRSVQFWGSIRLGMIALQTSLPRAVLGGSNPLMTSESTSIRNNWVQIQQSYMTYTRRIQLLEDYFPILVRQRKLLRDTRNGSRRVPRVIPSLRPETSHGGVLTPHIDMQERSSSFSSSDTIVVRNQSHTKPPAPSAKGFNQANETSENIGSCCVIC